jgi:hypothetical protein
VIEVDALLETQLPMGWAWKTMGEIAEVVSGGDVPPDLSSV